MHYHFREGIASRQQRTSMLSPRRGKPRTKHYRWRPRSRHCTRSGWGGYGVQLLQARAATKHPLAYAWNLSLSCGMKLGNQGCRGVGLCIYILTCLSRLLASAQFSLGPAVNKPSGIGQGGFSAAAVQTCSSWCCKVDGKNGRRRSAVRTVTLYMYPRRMTTTCLDASSPLKRESLVIPGSRACENRR